MSNWNEIHSRARKAAEDAHQDIPDTGAVGIADVRVYPGTQAFARWARSALGAFSITSGIFRGTSIGISTGKQSYAANDAAAKAYAAVLKDAGVQCIALCRFD